MSSQSEALSHVPAAIIQVRMEHDVWSLPVLEGALPLQLGLRDGAAAPGALLQRILGDDIETVSAAVADSLANMTTFECEFRLHADDGVRWLRAVATPRIIVGGVEWNGIVTDVSGRRRGDSALDEAYQRFRALVDHMPTGLALKDPHGQFLIVNAQYAAWFGLNPGETVGQTMGSVHADYIAERLLALDAGAIHRVVPTSAEISILRDGEHRVLSATSFPIMYFGCPIGVGTTLADVTERRRAEQAIIVAKNAAEAASQAKDEFLANMSHELRTPLNAIIGFSEMMKVEAFGPLQNDRYRQYVDDIFGSGSRLLVVINDVLDLANTGAGRLTLVKEPIHPAELLEDALDSMTEAANAAELTMALHVDPALPEVEADPGRLRRAIRNLLSNAIKFTPRGGSVELSASADDSALAIVIADTGIGIAPEHLDLALEPFRQVDGKLGRQFEGTGLGLPLAKRIMELHGGALKLESSLGHGTRVTVTLPIGRTAQA